MIKVLKRKGLVRVMQMALLIQTFSGPIRGVYTPLVAKKKNNLYELKMVWLSSVLFHVLPRQAPAAAASPALTYHCSFGFLGRGLEADTPRTERLGPPCLFGSGGVSLSAVVSGF